MKRCLYIFCAFEGIKHFHVWFLQENYQDSLLQPQSVVKQFPETAVHRRYSRNTEPKMNTIVFNKLSNQVIFEEKAKEVERSSRNYLEVIDGQHPDLLSNNQTIKDNSASRHRRSGYVYN